jgi:hypothetical protein
MLRGTRPLHREQHRTAPLAANADALHEPQDGQDDRAPDADPLIGRHQRHEKRRHAHQQQRRDQRRFAADAIAEVPEDGCADRPRHETDGVDRKRFESADERIRVREIQPSEHQSGDGAVEKKVVPLNRRPDRAREHGAAQLNPVLGLGQGRCRRR